MEDCPTIIHDLQKGSGLAGKFASLRKMQRAGHGRQVQEIEIAIIAGDRDDEKAQREKQRRRLKPRDGDIGRRPRRISSARNSSAREPKNEDGTGPACARNARHRNKGSGPGAGCGLEAQRLHLFGRPVHAHHIGMADQKIGRRQHPAEYRPALAEIKAGMGEDQVAPGRENGARRALVDRVGEDATSSPACPPDAANKAPRRPCGSRRPGAGRSFFQHRKTEWGSSCAAPTRS